MCASYNNRLEAGSAVWRCLLFLFEFFGMVNKARPKGQRAFRCLLGCHSARGAWRFE